MWLDSDIYDMSPFFLSFKFIGELPKAFLEKRSEHNQIAVVPDFCNKHGWSQVATLSAKSKAGTVHFFGEMLGEWIRWIPVLLMSHCDQPAMRQPVVGAEAKDGVAGEWEQNCDRHGEVKWCHSGVCWLAMPKGRHVHSYICTKRVFQAISDKSKLFHNTFYVSPIHDASQI